MLVEALYIEDITSLLLSTVMVILGLDIVSQFEATILEYMSKLWFQWNQILQNFAFFDFALPCMITCCMKFQHNWYWAKPEGNTKKQVKWKVLLIVAQPLRTNPCLRNQMKKIKFNGWSIYISGQQWSKFCLNEKLAR